MLQIRTLGRTTIAVNGEELSGEAAWPKSLALIVYMAREPGPDRRDDVLGVLWPDRDEKRARRALNQLLYTLRRTAPELDLESVENALDFGREVWLDVEEFEKRLEARDLEGAVELYGGPFLADLAVDEPEFEHWADRQRAELRRKFRKAALELARRAEARKDFDAAAGYCRRLLHSDPLDDEAQHLLIESLYRKGDRLEALRQFEIYRDLLARELEVEPLDHTLALVEEIRAGAAVGREAEGGEEAEPPEREPVVEEPQRPVPPDTSGPEGREEPEPVFDAGPSPEPPAGSRRGSWGRAVLGGLAVVAAAVLVFWFWPGGPGRGDGGGAPAAGGEAGMRIAVLPFVPHGLSAADEGLPAGCAQLVTRNLEGMGVSGVVSHRTVMERWMAGEMGSPTELDPRSLERFAGQLGVNTVLLGDLHASGDELRIVADLYDMRSHTVLAGADVRGPRDDLFQLLDRLSAELADAAALVPEGAASQQ